MLRYFVVEVDETRYWNLPPTVQPRPDRIWTQYLVSPDTAFRYCSPELLLELRSLGSRPEWDSEVRDADKERIEDLLREHEDRDDSAVSRSQWLHSWPEIAALTTNRFGDSSGGPIPEGTRGIHWAYAGHVLPDSEEDTLDDLMEYIHGNPPL